ncbi:hypothetical protein JCM4814A_81630 [Streptomyces phaeofaciens JCM 4814]|uniref:Uncharacterized protein n=1 Tax=Streptomyces phaeofaciens TaxID=68254 RepID=A0A918HPG2_9ACTN|nr:hypothetical protein GCM10010226_79650 [Streptomyces phaeofaciens]
MACEEGREWSRSRCTAGHTLARLVANTGFGIKGARTRPLVVLAGPGWGSHPAAPGMLCPAGLREASTFLGRHCAASSDPSTPSDAGGGRHRMALHGTRATARRR